jgi:hypothetical protein
MSHPAILKMGLEAGDLVLEVGRGDDCDNELRTAIETHIGSSLIDSDTDDVVDAVILWWREDDGDLTDAFVDVLTYLSETGPIWLMTPKVGRIGYLEASDIQDAAPPAGLSPTTGFNAAQNWTATKLVARKAGKANNK